MLLLKEPSSMRVTDCDITTKTNNSAVNRFFFYQHNQTWDCNRLQQTAFVKRSALNVRN